MLLMPQQQETRRGPGWTIVAVKPAATLELLAYMLTIIKASQQYDGLFWRSYDTNYRINVAAAGNKVCSRLDTDLYTQYCFTGRAKPAVVCSVCDNQAHTSQNARSPQGQARRGTSERGR